MITMEMTGKIRRMYLHDKLSLHEITKRVGLLRILLNVSTIEKYATREIPVNSICMINPGKGSPMKATQQ